MSMSRIFRLGGFVICVAALHASALAQVSELCSCTGRGGVNGVTLWGPKGEPCGGMKNDNDLPWGTYANSCVAVQKIGKCAGEGGVKDLELWGPPGNVCGGLWENKDRYSVGQRNAKDARLCSCKGKGGVDGVELWGPEGEFCAGIPKGWGKYDANCK
jgi:hypothetical protein